MAKSVTKDGVLQCKTHSTFHTMNSHQQKLSYISSTNMDPRWEQEIRQNTYKDINWNIGNGVTVSK